MATNDDYELLPHQEIEQLRQEIDELKRNPLGNEVDSQDLLSAVQELTKVMHKFTSMMSATNDEMVADFKRTTVSEHFAKISEQNQQIAEAVLTIAELVKSPRTTPQQQIPTQPMDHATNMPGLMTPPQQEVSQAPNIPSMPNKLSQPEHMQPLPDLNHQPIPPLDQGAPQGAQPAPTMPPPHDHEKKHKGGLGGLFKK